MCIRDRGVYMSKQVIACRIPGSTHRGEETTRLDRARRSRQNVEVVPLVWAHDDEQHGEDDVHKDAGDHTHHPQRVRDQTSEPRHEEPVAQRDCLPVVHFSAVPAITKGGAILLTKPCRRTFTSAERCPSRCALVAGGCALVVKRLRRPQPLGRVARPDVFPAGHHKSEAEQRDGDGPATSMLGACTGYVASTSHDECIQRMWRTPHWPPASSVPTQYQENGERVPNTEVDEREPHDGFVLFGPAHHRHAHDKELDCAAVPVIGDELLARPNAEDGARHAGHERKDSEECPRQTQQNHLLAQGRAGLAGAGSAQQAHTHDKQSTQHQDADNHHEGTQRRHVELALDVTHTLGLVDVQHIQVDPREHGEPAVPIWRHSQPVHD
eukprot:1120591-Prymnesium_polylepis.1